MKILDRAKLATKTLFGWGGANITGVWDYFSGDKARSSARSYLKRYEGIVYACVSAIAEEVGTYQPILKRPNARGELEPVVKHPMIDLIKNVNPSTSQFELFEGSQSFIDLTGEVFWYFPLGELTSKPKEILTLRPDKIKVIVDEDTGEIKHYELWREDGSKILLEDQEVLHFKMFNPHNKYRGMGTVQAGIEYIETEEVSTKFTKNFIKQNATPSGVVFMKGKVADKSFENFKRMWRENVAGVENAGKVAVVREAEVGFTKVGMGLDEIDLKGLRDLSEESILSIFRVPAPILGKSVSEGLGRDSAKTLEYIFMKRAIEPRLRRFDLTLQRMADRFWPNDNLVVTHQSTIPTDRKQLLEEWKAGADIWLTRNEIRGFEGLPEAEGGDILLQPAAQIEYGQVKQSNIGKIRVKSKQPVLKNADEIPVVEVDTNKKEAFRVELMGIADRFASIFEKELIKFLDTQKKSILETMKRVSPAKKAFDQWLFNEDEQAKEMTEALFGTQLALTEEAGKVGDRMIDEFIERAVKQFELNDEVRELVRASLLRASLSFTKDTADSLIETLAEGMSGGEGIRDLRKRVEVAYKSAQGYRAERIARTETIKASNKAAELAYRQSNVVTGKEWLANPDACEFCSEVDGKVVELDNDFAGLGTEVEGRDGGRLSVSHENVGVPPLHPNCKCSVIPVRREA